MLRVLSTFSLIPNSFFLTSPLRHCEHRRVVVESASIPRSASASLSRGGTGGGGWELRMEVPDVTDRFEAEVPDATWWF